MWGASEPRRDSWNSPGVPVFWLSLSPGPFPTVASLSKVKLQRNCPRTVPFGPSTVQDWNLPPAKGTCLSLQTNQKILPCHHRVNTLPNRLWYQERWWIERGAE